MFNQLLLYIVFAVTVHLGLECATGTYGYNCNEMCGHCLYGNNYCSRSNGICSNGCDAGWQGDNCKTECASGTYGYNCNETCGHCLYGNNYCSRSNGICSYGCDAGWHCDHCKTECVIGSYGYSCNETCGYCLHGNISCSTSNGICIKGCDAGWHGDNCKTGMVNFALNKPAYLSTTLTWNNFNWTADKAVDGNSNGSSPATSRTCSATKHIEPFVNHTWEVDIGVQIAVKNIIVYGRTDGVIDELDGFMMYLGNTSEQWKYSQGLDSGPATVTQYSKYVFNVTSSIARYITLVRYNKILVVCEVIVEGDCARGTYGSGCIHICGHCIKGNINCSTINGMCLEGCEAGWNGDTCTVEQVTSSDVGPDVGVIVGSSLAAVGVFVFAIVIIIVFIKKRKKNTKETSAVQMTTSPHYANLAVGNAGSEINVLSIEDLKMTGLDKEDSRLQRRNSNGESNSHIRLQDPDGQGNKEYETLRVGCESDESTYSTIDHALMKTPIEKEGKRLYSDR